jgi:membrane-bound serine protease (ClpP class)
VFILALTAGVGLRGEVAPPLRGEAEPAATPPREQSEPAATPPREQSEPAATPPREQSEPAATPPREQSEPHPVKSNSPKPLPLTFSGDPIVYHAHLKDVVELGLAPYLIRAIDEAEKAGASVLIVEIDTPGGRVDAAVQIKDALLESKVPTVAFIHNQAISAGALIALAHDYIIWTTGGTMGAATPIQMGADQTAESVEEKMVSYMRGLIASTAEAKGRDPFVAECMVDASLVLPGYAPEGKLLTARFGEAEELGLWDGTASSLAEVLTLLGLPPDVQVTTVRQNWAESIARMITHPVTSSVLMSIGMLGLLIEFYTPGFGFAGILGILSLVLFFAGHLVVNLAGLEEVILFLIGALLLGAEFFVIPGFGIAGVLGVACIAASLILALVGLDIRIAWDLGIVYVALSRFLLSLAIAGVGTVLAVRYLPDTRLFGRLVLRYSLTTEAGAVAGGESMISGALLGRIGIALTDLRPVGRALIDGERVDVSAQSEFIAKGTHVRVTHVDGPTVLVESTSEAEEG